MGKKSKRRTGKKDKSQKKKEAVEDEEEAGTRSRAEDAALVLDEREQQLADDFDRELDEEAFEEFMLWSLSEKSDLTPKKFEKMAPRIARTILNGQPSTLKFILNKRVKAINTLEEQIEERRKEFHLVEGIKLFMTQVNLGSEEDEAEFRQDMEEIAEKQKTFMDPLENIFESFQEVSKKWTKSRNVCLDDCLFYNWHISNFCSFFDDMMVKFVHDMDMLQSKDRELFRKFFFHSLDGQTDLKDELQKLLFSVLTLYQEMNTCWECKKIDGKALICESCKCATYCSRECQVKHWEKAKHRECCEATCLKWSSYQRRKHRVGKAFYKKRVYAKPIKVNGIEKECFLRPCEPIDYFLCTMKSDNNTNGPLSMDVFYENLAKLACGGKHLLFRYDAVSSELEEKIRTSYEDVISEFDTTSLKKGELDAMRSILEKLVYTNTELVTDELNEIREGISVDRFITLYICFEPLNLGNDIYNKFEVETDLLQRLKRSHDKMKLR